MHPWKGASMVAAAWLAQSYGVDASPFFGLFLVALLISGGLAIIPAYLATNKGYSGIAFWFFGLAFFVPALIVVLLIQPKPGRASIAMRRRA